MVENRAKFLSDLPRKQLWDEFLKSQYPKWSSLCLLTYAGFRVLDAAFISPQALKADARRIIIDFANRLSENKILIRTDGGKETGAYPRGGNSLSIEQSLETVPKILSANRAVILMSPTNRFTNKLSANLHLDHSGIFYIEVLGPGFDVSDLNRGLVNPEISIAVKNICWEDYEPPSPFSIKYETNQVNQLRQQRLIRIGNELLLVIGIHPSEQSPETFAEEWLVRSGYIGLFEEQRPTISFDKICEWYENAFILGSMYRRKIKWNDLVISTSDLGDAKGLTFWDIANSQEKFSNQLSRLTF